MVSRKARSPRLALVLPTWLGVVTPALYWTRLCEALGDVGIPTEIIIPKVTAAKVKPLRAPERQGRGYEGSTKRGVLLSPRSVSALVRSPATVFLCLEYGVATLICAVVARLRRRRVIIFQEHAGRSGVPLGRWERRYRRMLGVLAHAFVANTDSAYAEIADALRIPRRKIHRATLLVPPERAMLTRDREVARKPARRPLFVFVGRLIPQKNVSGLLDAAAVLEARGHEFEVWVVGDGRDRAALEAKAADLIAKGVVRFLGEYPSTAIGAVYDAADIFVMPSLRDYRSVAVLEALRFGKPVIDSVYDGNTNDIVRHELNGLIFDPEHAGSLEGAMERLINDPDLVRNLGFKANEIMKTYTPTTAATALADVIRTITAVNRTR